MHSSELFTSSLLTSQTETLQQEQKPDITNLCNYLSFKLLLTVFESLPRPFETTSLLLLKDSLRLPLSHQFSRVMLEIREDFVVSWIQTGNCCVVFKLWVGQPLTDGDVNKEAVAESRKPRSECKVFECQYLQKEAKSSRAQNECACT